MAREKHGRLTMLAMHRDERGKAQGPFSEHPTLVRKRPA